MIGRIFETQELERLYDSNESEFVAVYGRRRVGKTYLVREVFDERFTFQHTGLPKGRVHAQLAHFHKSLVSAGLGSCPEPKDWMTAFDLLKSLIDMCNQNRKVVFIDEGVIKEENTPTEFFEHPQNERLKEFLSKVL